MEVFTDVQSSSTVTGSFETPSWNRTRGTSELLGFIARREAAVADYNLADEF